MTTDEVSVLAREHALSAGLCDNFWCSRVGMLRPVFDADGHEAARLCALGCDDREDES